MVYLTKEPFWHHQTANAGKQGSAGQESETIQRRYSLNSRIFISFSSPAGSTRHVAETINTVCTDSGCEVHLMDLGRQSGRAEFRKRITGAGPGDCLFMGSPVYRDMAVPPVMAFIESLPEVSGCNAVPFVTWGGAFSGIALWQMGRELDRKGFNLAGGVKVLGTHSMMWAHPNPAGNGHPDGNDDEMVRRFTLEILGRLSSGKAGNFALENLDYNAEEFTADIKKKLGQPWMIIPKAVDMDKCTLCGVCEEVCPVGAVEVDAEPIFNETCFDCFNCIRLCPEEAIAPAFALEKIHAMICERVEKFNERPVSEVFI